MAEPYSGTVSLYRLTGGTVIAPLRKCGVVGLLKRQELAQSHGGKVNRVVLRPAEECFTGVDPGLDAITRIVVGMEKEKKRASER